MTNSWIYGFHPVCELLRARPGQVVRLMSSAKGKRQRAVAQLAGDAGIAVEAVSSDRIALVLVEEAGVGRGIADAVHNGFAAEVDETAAPTDGPVDPGLLVLLEDVQDPRNLGALLRVCDGAGVARVLIRDRGSAPLGPTAIKTSAGAAEYVDVERITNSADVIERYREQGFWCFGADAAGRPAWEVDLSGPMLLCIGGEESGLRQRTRQMCDELIALPMRGRVSSLNVATAASALLFESVRQRSQASISSGDG